MQLEAPEMTSFSFIFLDKDTTRKLSALDPFPNNESEDHRTDQDGSESEDATATLKRNVEIVSKNCDWSVVPCRISDAEPTC
jgi:hypothetical protein